MLTGEWLEMKGSNERCWGYLGCQIDTKEEIEGDPDSQTQQGGHLWRLLC